MATATFDGALARPLARLDERVVPHAPADTAARVLPPAVIYLLTWNVAALAAHAGWTGEFDRLTPATSALAVTVGAVAALRWRALGERALLWAGLTLVIIGLVRPTELVVDVPTWAFIAGAVAVSGMGFLWWVQGTAAAVPATLFAAGAAQAAVAHVAIPGSAALFMTAALVFAAEGLSGSLVGSIRAQRAELQAHRVAGAAARAAREERDHDVRSALMAIEGAARTLERYHDRLDAGSRAMLATSLSSEVSRLQRLVEESGPAPWAPFSVAEALVPVVTLALTEGVDVTLSAGVETVAFGHGEETARIVQTLLDNARVHAAGSPVRVSIDQRDGWVIVRVIDRGPGIVTGDHERILERGQRGARTPDGTGSGLGLATAARLAQVQGGALWAEDRPGGGACFVLRLQAAPPVRSGARGQDGLDG